MAEVQQYEYIWSLDTDAFLLGPITYDVFGLMAARNATYGYMDINVEDPKVAGGLGECVDGFLRKHPGVKPTMLHRFRSGGSGGRTPCARRGAGAGRRRRPASRGCC